MSDVISKPNEDVNVEQEEIQQQQEEETTTAPQQEEPLTNTAIRKLRIEAAKAEKTKDRVAELEKQLEEKTNIDLDAKVAQIVEEKLKLAQPMYEQILRDRKDNEVIRQVDALVDTLQADRATIKKMLNENTDLLDNPDKIIHTYVTQYHLKKEAIASNAGKDIPSVGVAKPATSEPSPKPKKDIVATEEDINEAAKTLFPK